VTPEQIELAEAWLSRASESLAEAGTLLRAGHSGFIRLRLL
jgi:hypothetical protein